jgi:hypothetical protein
MNVVCGVKPNPSEFAYLIYADRERNKGALAERELI